MKWENEKAATAFARRELVRAMLISLSIGIMLWFIECSLSLHYVFTYSLGFIFFIFSSSRSLYSWAYSHPNRSPRLIYFSFSLLCVVQYSSNWILLWLLIYPRNSIHSHCWLSLRSSRWWENIRVCSQPPPTLFLMVSNAYFLIYFFPVSSHFFISTRDFACVCDTWSVAVYYSSPPTPFALISIYFTRLHTLAHTHNLG